METQGLNIESTTSHNSSEGAFKDNGSVAVPQGQATEKSSQVTGEDSSGAPTIKENPSVTEDRDASFCTGEALTKAEVDKDSTEVEGVSEPFLVIRHNHEDKGLTEKEAVTLAQKGMAYDSVFKAVARAAALQGKSVKEFVNGFEASADESYRKTLVEKFGDDKDTIDALMELYFVKKEDKIKDFKEDTTPKGNEADDRLEGEFKEFKKHFPEVDSFSDLPQPVRQNALNGGDLLSEYLRYRFFETQKAEAAKLNARAASDASVGSAATDEQVESAETAFIKGLQMV